MSQSAQIRAVAAELQQIERHGATDAETDQIIENALAAGMTPDGIVSRLVNRAAATGGYTEAERPPGEYRQ